MVMMVNRNKWKRRGKVMMMMRGKDCDDGGESDDGE